LKLDINKPTFCLVNISRNGLKNLALELVNNPVFEIVYIGCCQKSVDKDLIILNKKFNIINQYKFKEGDNLLIISHLKRHEIISLGSTCSIAYQLQKNNYRINSYPFDWLKINNLNNINTCLEEDFKNFIPAKNNTSELTGELTSELTGEQVSKFPLIIDDFPEEKKDTSTQIQTTKIINKYDMIFYHDFDHNLTNYDNICEKYQRRIIKFKNQLIIGCELVYIELKPQNLKIQDVNNLVKLLNLDNNNNKITIIVHNPKNKVYNIFNYKKDRVRIINDISTFDSWKRDNFDWKHNLFFY
jgi:hypothetical protein